MFVASIFVSGKQVGSSLKTLSRELQTSSSMHIEWRILLSISDKYCSPLSHSSISCLLASLSVEISTKAVKVVAGWATVPPTAIFWCPWVAYWQRFLSIPCYIWSVTEAFFLIPQKKSDFHKSARLFWQKMNGKCWCWQETQGPGPMSPSGCMEMKVLMDQSILARITLRSSSSHSRRMNFR